MKNEGYKIYIVLDGNEIIQELDDQKKAYKLAEDLVNGTLHDEGNDNTVTVYKLVHFIKGTVTQKIERIAPEA